MNKEFETLVKCNKKSSKYYELLPKTFCYIESLMRNSRYKYFLVLILPEIKFAAITGYESFNNAVYQTLLLEMVDNENSMKYNSSYIALYQKPKESRTRRVCYKERLSEEDDLINVDADLKIANGCVVKIANGDTILM